MPRLDETDPDRPVVVLFRRDLRITDNAALTHAAGSGKPVVPVFILETPSDARGPGAASRWWLHHSLAGLRAELKRIGLAPVLRAGDQQIVVEALIDDTGADAVVWNRRYDPAGMRADIKLKSALKVAGIACASHEGQLLHEPSCLLTGAGGPYRVFTPFWRALAAAGEPRTPSPAPRRARPFPRPVAGETLDDWHLLPRAPDWSGGIAVQWTPGEAGAKIGLTAFLDHHLDDYADNRDRPDLTATSRLSPHLAFGEITPFQIWHAVAARTGGPSGHDAETFIKELAWREFSYHLLFHNPNLAEENFNASFDRFEWHGSGAQLKQWQSGLTGYPFVDAGMRQLWRTGWMHNRVRMVAASFLVKHLLIDWRAGERWFWDTLVDADPANNAASWQWVAGSGADAAPYFRIFNPVLQGEKFDPQGAYVRRFVPEIAGLPDRYIHRPWEAPVAMRAQAGIDLGTTYPKPLVAHGDARQRALRAYQSMRGAA